jgi:prepilin-type processing-associated H-X9-DG protein
VSAPRVAAVDSAALASVICQGSPWFDSGAPFSPWTDLCLLEIRLRGGPFREEGPVRIGDMLDGSSNTAAFSERLAGDGDPFRVDNGDVLRNNTACRAVTLTTALAVTECEQTANTQAMVPPPSHASDFGIGFAAQVYGHLHHTIYNHLFTPNSLLRDCHSCQSFIDSPNESAIVTARSYHPGGVNVLLCDGAVRFVGDSVDRAVWTAVGTIAGKEQVSNAEF